MTHSFLVRKLKHLIKLRNLKCKILKILKLIVMGKEKHI